MYIQYIVKYVHITKERFLNYCKVLGVQTYHSLALLTITICLIDELIAHCQQNDAITITPVI